MLALRQAAARPARAELFEHPGSQHRAVTLGCSLRKVDDLDEVTNELLTSSREVGRRRSALRIQRGVVHLDFGDPDAVFRVTVQKVTRTRLTLDRPIDVGVFDDVTYALTDVAVANHIEVRVDAVPGPRQGELTASFQADYDRWARASPPNGMPPPWPAESCSLGIAVTDDVGTGYARQFGQVGGEDRPWETWAMFWPTPPPEATTITLTFTAPGRSPATVTLATKVAPPSVQ